MGCERVGEVAKGGQLFADQGQEWMGIRTTSKKAGSPSKTKVQQGGKGLGWNKISSDMYSVICDL